MYDAIVVGARCAGSPTAMLLARKGHRVLLVDRASFPSDTMSTHLIHPPGIARLERWGLLGRVTASNCPPCHEISMDFGAFSLSGHPPPMYGVAEHYCPRRTVLDKILVDAAVEAGVQLREGFRVEELLRADGDRVTGVVGRTAGGARAKERARIVVGADGMRSLVARTVGASEYDARPALTCAYYTYWSGVSVQSFEIYPRGRWIVMAFPTNDGLVCTFCEWPLEEFHSVRADIEGHFLKKLELAPGLAQRLREGRREANFMGTGVLPNFFRKPYGPGWALVGDAGHHKDPVGGLGIMDAFRDAELLVDALDAGLSGRQSLDEALGGYEQRRNAATMQEYEKNYQSARLHPPSDEMRRLFAALRGNQHETNRFFGTIARTLPSQEFLSSENIQRIINAA
jgi:2-polyprenyl-6-methoxyphenol hydroxylase-like FAD-dependent oxidoreductase